MSPEATPEPILEPTKQEPKQPEVKPEVKPDFEPFACSELADTPFPPWFFTTSIEADNCGFFHDFSPSPVLLGPDYLWAS